MAVGSIFEHLKKTCFTVCLFLVFYSVFSSIILEPNKGSSSVVEIHPIKGASPMPEPVAGNLTAAMHDCILGEWGEWSECLTDDANGYASPHQVRERSVVQPYLPGGQPCELTVESRTCQLISAANTLVNLGE